MAGQDANPSEFSEGQVVDASYAAPRMQPGGISPITIIAIILGLLGILGGISQIASPLVGKMLHQKSMEAAEANPDNPQLQMQADLQRMAMAVAQKYGTVSVVLGVIMLLVCTGLLISAIMAMKGSEKGRKMLAGMCLLLLLCDLGKAVFAVIQQKESMDGMSGAMTKMFEADPNMQQSPQADQAKQIAGTAMKVGMIFSIVVAVGWFLVKAVFYIFSWRYLNRPPVKEYFAANATGA